MNRRSRAMLTLLLRASVSLAVVGAVACGGGDDGTGPVVTPPAAEKVARIDLSAPSTTLAPQQTVQFAASVKSSTGSTIGSVSPSWASSAAAIASVNQSGLVTAVSAGTATISATLDGVTGTASVTVTSGAGVLATVVATSQDPTLELGSFTQVTVAGRDVQGGAVALGNRIVTFTSSNTSIATISASGVAAAVGVGTVSLQVSVLDGTTPRTASIPLVVVGVPGAPLSATVDMLPTKFLPFETTIKQNGTVRFVFPTLAHNVIWDRRLSGAPTDINTTADATISRNFPTSGVFDFVCTLHPGMEGRIIVSP